MAASTIKELLSLLKMEPLYEHFEKNYVDFETLLILQESEIKELLPQVGARRKILNYLKNVLEVHVETNVQSENKSVSTPCLQPSTVSASTVMFENDGREDLSNKDSTGIHTNGVREALNNTAIIAMPKTSESEALNDSIGADPFKNVRSEDLSSTPNTGIAKNFGNALVSKTTHSVIPKNERSDNSSINEIGWLEQMKFQEESVDLGNCTYQSLDSISQSSVNSECRPQSRMVHQSDTESIVLELDPYDPTPSKKFKGIRRFFPNEQSLHDLIRENSKLSGVKQAYNAKGYLVESDRRILVAVIMDRLLDRHIKVNRDTLKELANNICEEFPTEIPSIYYSFNPNISKNQRGKLCDRYHNELKTRKRYRIRPTGVTTASSTYSKPTEDPDHKMEWIQHSHCSKPITVSPASEDLDYKIEWLKQSQEPWDTVLLYWMETFPIRQKQRNSLLQLHEFMQNWPILQHEKGHSLVNNYLFIYGFISIVYLHPLSNYRGRQSWLIYNYTYYMQCMHSTSRI